jgi:hypothetical protein
MKASQVQLKAPAAQRLSGSSSPLLPPRCPPAPEAYVGLCQRIAPAPVPHAPHARVAPEQRHGVFYPLAGGVGGQLVVLHQHGYGGPGHPHEAVV